MKKILFGLFVAAIAFVSLALLFFAPTDRGWAYEDTSFEGVYHNKLGVIGAWCSSFLLYYIGGGVWILLLMCLCFCWYAYKNCCVSVLLGISMRFLVMVCMVCTHAAFFNSDYVPCIEPGGALGQYAKQLIKCLDNYTVEHNVISVLWMACIMLIFPFEYLRLASKILPVNRLYGPSKSFKVARKYVEASPRYQLTLEELICEVTMQKNE